MTIINEERIYWELKEGIRMMNSQGSGTKRLIYSKKVKKQILAKSLNAMKTMLSYFLKCEK